jgi:hypothetical protein
VLRVLRSCGEKDITLDYESRDWGFKSLRERAGSPLCQAVVRHPPLSNH